MNELEHLEKKVADALRAKVAANADLDISVAAFFLRRHLLSPQKRGGDVILMYIHQNKSLKKLRTLGMYKFFPMRKLDFWLVIPPFSHVRPMLVIVIIPMNYIVDVSVVQEW